MSTGLNIKDPEAHRLARAIAQRTGEPMTRIIVDALRDRLAVLDRQGDKASVEELLTIARRTSQLVKGPQVPHGDLLYDEGGVPR
jgi:antitoxin VapB